MNQSINLIYKEVLSGRNLVENIPRLLNYMVGSYHCFAGIRLSMHYYALTEAFLEDGQTWREESKSIYLKIKEIIKLHVQKNGFYDGMERSLKEIDSLRKEIMERMTVLTLYSDIFKIYEYVLNRVEYQFKDGKELPEDDDEFAKEILRYIFDSKDNAVINEKIREIIGQLPVRITRQKYYNILRESLKNYLGAERSSLESYLYMLRTSAMLYNTEGTEKYYLELKEFQNELSRLQYNQITEGDYQKATFLLQSAVKILENEISHIYDLQEIINEIYALILCSPYIGTDSYFAGIDETAFRIISEINTSTNESIKSADFEKIGDGFTFFEGIQEEMCEDLIYLEEALSEVDKNHRNLAESMMVEKLLNLLLYSRKLLSESIFIDLDKEKKDEIVNETLLDKIYADLIKDMEYLFQTVDRAVIRSIMANTMDKLPVFFGDEKEVMDYIRYSLSKCNDGNEKQACYELINKIMKD